MSRSLLQQSVKKGGDEPRGNVAALWHGTVANVLDDGTVWVVVPRLAGDDPFGPVRSIPGGLQAGEPVLVGAVEGLIDDLFVLSRMAGGGVPAHTHAWADVTGKPTVFPTNWANVADKPSTYAPQAHTHPAAEVSDSTPVGRALITAASAAAGRDAIGAGTSSLIIGGGSTNAKAGNYIPDYAEITGTVPTSALPPLAVIDTFTPESESEMLALDAQRGDIAIRMDTEKTYVLSSNSPGTLADWKEVLAAGQVVSVAGKNGVVSLVKSDVGLSNVDNTSDAAKPISAVTQNALDGKSATGHTHPWDSITSKPSSYPPAAHSHSWGSITSRPSTFPPSSHGHAIDQITGLQAALEQDTGWQGIDLENGYTGGDGLGVCKVDGRKVYIRGLIKKSVGAYQTAYTYVGLMPEEFWPPTYMKLTLPTYGTGNASSLIAHMNTDGRIEIQANGTENSADAYFAHTWLK